MLSSSLKKRDKYGQEIKPGDVCVRLVRGNMTSTLQFCVFEKPAWGGKGSKGEFGRFITPDGTRTIKYTNVVFMFDSMSDRRSRAEQVIEVTRKFYEGNNETI